MKTPGRLFAAALILAPLPVTAAFAQVAAASPAPVREAAVQPRVIVLEQGSNFRDLGGYRGAGGKHVRHGLIFRSGALPMLTEADYARLSGLRIRTIVDLRSLEEREVAPTMLDDRTGALFVANDYSFADLASMMAQARGENVYSGIERRLAPQYRSIFRRLLADDGPVLFHCSAGQDRTGVAAALILSALGVPRETILADYHLSTRLRRPAYEMPAIDPAQHPGNPIVALYARAGKRPGGGGAEPLFAASGASHLAQFLDMIDSRYGGVSAYLAQELQVGEKDIRRLRRIYLR